MLRALTLERNQIKDALLMVLPLIMLMLLARYCQFYMLTECLKHLIVITHNLLIFGLCACCVHATYFVRVRLHDMCMCCRASHCFCELIPLAFRITKIYDRSFHFVKMLHILESLHLLSCCRCFNIESFVGIHLSIQQSFFSSPYLNSEDYVTIVF